MDGYDAGTYGRAFADVYDDWFGEVSDVDATVEGVLALVRARAEGPVLELGVGTGRLALPLAALGVDIVGLDASSEMLDQLRAKPGAAAVRAVLGDMAAVGEVDDGPFAVVFAAFNTFFNLTTRDAQLACLRGVAQRLAPDGCLAIEAFVPPEPGTAPDSVVTPRSIERDRVVLTVAKRDPDTQTIAGQHIELTEAGGVRLRPWLVRYAAPRELDELAGEAGLVLVSRDADWRGAPFDDTSTAHVSVYRTAER